MYVRLLQRVVDTGNLAAAATSGPHSVIIRLVHSKLGARRCINAGRWHSRHMLLMRAAGSATHLLWDAVVVVLGMRPAVL